MDLKVPPMSLSLPQASGFDNSIALLRDPYGFVSTRCDALGTDAFRTRLMLRPVICLRGADAAGLLYSGDHFTRVGAMPTTTLKLLQDRGSVQQLDGEAHRHRKALFTRILLSEAPVMALAARFEAEWRAAEDRWLAKGEATLLPEAGRMLARAACDWSGVPWDALGGDAAARDLDAMIANAGRIGPGTVTALARRSRMERVLVDVVRRIRSGAVALPAEAPARLVAEHREADGHALAPEIAAVEILNLIRPIFATSRFIVFAAIALARNPDWRDVFAGGDETYLYPFAEEVRRISPFFPVVGGRAREDFEWRGHAIAQGQWAILDLYGTCHDARLFPDSRQFRPERGLSWRSQDFAFIPQGGGDVHGSHRCPGEWAVVELIAVAIRGLCRLAFEPAPKSLELPLDKIPPQPPNGFAMRKIRRREGAG